MIPSGIVKWFFAIADTTFSSLQFLNVMIDVKSMVYLIWNSVNSSV